jgi:hypothetical protein
VDIGLSKSASVEYAAVGGGDPVIYGPPAWIRDYPHTAIYAAGYVTLTDIHIEGAVIGIFIPEISGNSNVVATNIKTLAMMDRARGAVYELDGRSGAAPPTNTDYYGYGCAVLIAGSSEAGGSLNLKQSATLTAVSTNGGCCYLVRDAVYAVNRTSFGMGQFALSPTGEGSGGRFAFYTRGNIYRLQSENVTTANGNGTTATLTFPTRTVAVHVVGSTIIVAGVTPSGYNGTFVVTASSATFLSFNDDATKLKVASSLNDKCLVNSKEVTSDITFLSILGSILSGPS